MLNSRHWTDSETLLVDRRLYEVWFGGKRIPLTATEYDLLEALHRGNDRVISRLELHEMVWGDGGRGLRVVDYVSRLRTKLRAAGHPGVMSIRKRGYRLAGSVEYTG
ncbi:MAG: winged helix-turn-helix domain-containing protein [Chloroflexi bacterium]|nr:winged helix-turn-helix domain-containing protein [Chloroflexota bacterium]